MKLHDRQLRFLARTPLPWRGRLQFVGRENTLQLLETAMVIEGNLQSLWFPLADWFFRRVLSGWTTVTIPYSRIVRCRDEARMLLRLLLTALVWSPGVLLMGVGWAEIGGGELLQAAGLVSLGSLLLSVYVNVRLGRRISLVYRRADGRTALVSFRIPAHKLRSRFLTLLQDNRRAAAGLAGAAQRREGQIALEEPSRWHDGVRWMAAGVLALHGVLAVLPPVSWLWRGNFGAGGASFSPGLDPLNLLSLLLHLILAALLAVRPTGRSAASDDTDD